MIGQPPFVVTITTPSSGVGKSTLASNLAVYLKGLAEDLSVAYVSCDLAATEAMFAFPGCTAHHLSEFQQGTVFEEVLTLGEFGVEFCYADSAAANESSVWLRKALAQVDFDGIVILDLNLDHPLLPAAIWAADMLLVPVKDPSILGEVVALRKQLLAGGGCEKQFWLLPSELGDNGRYQRSGQLADFLRFAADERGFQVLGETFVDDLQVREQAAEKAKPVLTRVRQSPLHSQLQQLAELVLAQREQQSSYATRIKRWQQDGLLPSRAQRVDLVCPLCQRGVFGTDVHYLESIPARQRMLLHRSCLEGLLLGTGAGAFLASAGLLLIQSGAAHGGASGELHLQILSPELTLLNSEFLSSESIIPWSELVRRATGRHVAELYQEQLLVSRCLSIADALSAEWYRSFVALRGQLRDVCSAEKI